MLLAEHSAKVHDVSALVDELVVEDSLNPSDLYESIVQAAQTVNVLYQEEYAATQRVSVRLSTLRSEYERKDRVRAIKRLRYRSRLQIDEDLLVPLNDPTHVFSCDCSYLDFILIVGSHWGLDLFMPNITVDYTFKATFDFKH